LGDFDGLGEGDFDAACDDGGWDRNWGWDWDGT